MPKSEAGETATRYELVKTLTTMAATKTTSGVPPPASKESSARPSLRPNPIDTRPAPVAVRQGHDQTAQGIGHDFGQTNIRRPSSITIQPKLAINQPGDIYEQEADRVAEQVVGMPTPFHGITLPAFVQRQTPEEEEKLEVKPLAATITPLVQRTSINPASTFAPHPGFEGQLRSTGDGSQIPASALAFMESRFGADFSQVRLHHGNEAAELNRSIHALAFTHGRNIYFRQGRGEIESAPGRELLAHELTHVLQQNSSRGSGSDELVQRDSPSGPNAPATEQAPTTTASDPAQTPTPDAANASTPTTSDGASVDRIIAALREPQENGVGNFPVAFGILDGMRTVEMLHTLEEIRRRGFFDLLHDNSPENMPRVRVALAAVTAKAAPPVTGRFATENPAFGALPEEQQREVADYLGLPWPVTADAVGGVAGMTSIEKLSRAIFWAREGRDQELQNQLDALRTPQALFAAGAFAALFLGAQFTPAGWVADALVLTAATLTAFFTGLVVFQVIGDLGTFAGAINATSDEELKAAGEALDRAVVAGGITLVLAAMTHAVGKVASGGPPSAGAPPERFAVTPDGQLVKVHTESIPENAHATQSNGPGNGPATNPNAPGGETPVTPENQAPAQQQNQAPATSEKSGTAAQGTQQIPGATPAENAVDQLLMGEGHDVKPNLQEGKQGAGRQGDRFVDGKLTEIKTISGVEKTDANSLSAAIANRVMNGRGQAGDIIVDVRQQAGMTEEIAERGVNRAYGADNKTGGKIQSIRVIGKDFDITRPRSK
jgi:hypothetical protein